MMSTYKYAAPTECMSSHKCYRNTGVKGEEKIFSVILVPVIVIVE